MSIIFGKDYNGENDGVPRYGLWRILFHPATTVSEYFSGKRTRYFSPIGVLSLLSALCVLISYWAGIKMMASRSEISGLAPIIEYMNTYPVVFWLLTAPVTALVFKWIFAKVSDLKYVEYLYIEIFLSVIGMTITCIRIVFLSVFPALETMAVYLFSGIEIVVFVGVEATVFYSLLGISPTRAIFSSIAGNVVGHALLITAIFVVTFLYVLIINL